MEALTERRLAAIILGDVVGYSRLMGLDEVGTMAALKAHQQDLVKPILRSARARLVDSAGDAMLIEFGSAVSAVSCAVAIQRGMIERNKTIPPERQLRFRLGINLGDIVVDEDKIYGDGVNVAARLESLCEPGGLCISYSIYEQVRGRLPYDFEDGGEQSLKNIMHPVRVFRVSAAFIASQPAPAAQPAPPPPGPSATQSVPGRGTVLNDTYQIDALVGAGGMGEIFRGHEIHSGGGVAIKLIRPEMMDHQMAASLFQREALILKDITHDAIVRYYSFSFDPVLRRHYLVMEFADGPSLPALLREAGPLAPEAVSTLRRRLAAGLVVAHERGVIHRDISSDNVILPGREVKRAKLIDFGIARSSDFGSTIIGDGFAGKLRYASPEQLGLAGGEVTPLSDIYSLGLVLAEAALGQPLEMGGSQAEVIEKRRAVPALDGIDPGLAALLQRMLQPDPAQRPQSMQEIVDWGPAATSSGIGASTAIREPRASPGPPSPSLAALPVRPPERPIERWIMAGAVGLVLVGGVAVGTYLWLSQPARLRPGLAATPTETVSPQTVSPPSSPPSEATPPPVVKADTPAPEPTVVPPKTLADAGPQPPSVPEAKPETTTSRIAAWVKAYDGGGCFFAMPVQVTANSAAIDSFGANKDTFQAFDTAFTRDIGFSAAIVGNRIWSKQCPAIDFLRQTGAGDPDAPTLFLLSTEVSRGKTLAGDIRSAARVLALLRVREDGTVTNESQALKADGNARTFEIPAGGGSGTAAVPQMLVAIASSRPLNALSQSGPVAAAVLFPQILAEAKSDGGMVGAAAKLFLLKP